MDEYRKRREKLAQQLPNDSIAVLPGAKLKLRNGDAEYPFRQNSDFYYLTGFSEPDCWMVLSKDPAGKVNYILFNRPRDPVAEIWSGKRVGQDGATSIFGADQAYSNNELDQIMPKLLENKQVMYYSTGARLPKWQNIPKEVINLSPLIHELRLFKSEYEIGLMRKAAQISAEAHIKVMQACKPNIMEYELEAAFVEHCLRNGCRSLAYNTIVASGPNACTLHYIDNNKKITAKDLVLIDAGGEYHNYAADITRTFPATGRFTDQQRKIYALVLKAQEAGIAQIKPGNVWNSVQEAMLQVMVSGLVELGILQGNVDQLIADQAYKKFYMHSSGHWLGLDVHDAGEYKIKNAWRKFEPGMVFTVEPGIYIAPNAEDVDQQWLGIGVRIEDDILVTKDGCEVLSKDAPKQLTEIERVAI